ncbi:MAG: D-arabinono-1,4-lactone oxidase [Parvibaculaceae bacterium]|nr:D-arabinono-1,4-lactone oxidase [Parvibaculaceae bacterium]
MQGSWSNWSGWVKAWPREIAIPETEADLQRVVREAEGGVRVAGSGHSFTALVQTNGTIVSLQKITGLLDVDDVHERARVGAGITIRDLGPLLHEKGLGLINQGDIDRQAIAGAVGTGTHGTGGTLGSLSSAVRGFRLVTASGEAIDCNSEVNADIFDAGRVSMGSLGIMSEITLQCRKAYALEEKGGRMPVDEVFARAPELRDANRHFEFFWFPFAHEVLTKTLNETDRPVKPRNRLPDGADASEDKLFRQFCEVARHVPLMRGPLQKFITRASGSRYAGSAGRAYWSHDAFPSDRNVRFNEMEYAVPAEKGIDCVREVGEHMRRCGVNFLFPIEFRYVAADDAWLSPFYHRASVSISVHQYHRQPYAELFRGIEEIFRRYEGRPHWGKLHTLGASELVALYPRWDDFIALRRRLDPQGKFLNQHLRRVFGES